MKISKLLMSVSMRPIVPSSVFGIVTNAHYSSLDARVVKGVDLRSTGLEAAWVRTPLQADFLLRRRAQFCLCVDVRGLGLPSEW